MDWIQGISGAIGYIEENLMNEIDIGDVSSQVFVSASHFQRIFNAVTGITIGDYIRNRRLSLAGLDLLANSKIIDIAMRYQYDTQESFSKAFARFHGFPPSVVKTRGDELKCFEPITIDIFIQGGFHMSRKMLFHKKRVLEPRISEKDALYLCGFLVAPGSGNLWKKYESATALHDTPALVDWTAYEARFYLPEGEQVFIGCQQEKREESPHYELLAVPAATWAMFEIDCKYDAGPQYVAIDRWISANKDRYEHFSWDADGRVTASEFVICRYDHQGKFGKDSIMEMWVPLKAR